MSALGRPVLVIDDDQYLRELYVTRLRRLGYRAEGAANGRDGIQAALADPPRLVILDLLLPDMDGWEVARQLRADVRTAQVPVLVASVLDSDGRDEGVNVDGHLVKPFGARELRTVIARIAGPPADASLAPDDPEEG